MYIYVFTFQRSRLALGVAGHHRPVGGHLLSGNVLSVGLPLPPSEESHLASENTEEKNKEQRQREEQDPGRQSAFL